MSRTRIALLGGGALLIAGLLAAARAGEEPASPFAPSNLTTATGKLADPDAYYEAGDCGECHTEQFRQWKGSLHSRAHHDSIYRAFADRAREEGGDALYRFCSGCHAPAAVATGEIPGGEHTFLTDEGVTCEVCHQVKEVRRTHGTGGSNASLVLSEGEVRYGPLADPGATQAHDSAHSPVHAKAEFCSGCHTLIHPFNGLVIENTYEEWKKGPYAAAGIQCQDCHMRTVEQAREVARTMKPLRVPGKTYADGEPRDNVYAHLFTGGNVNARLTGSGERHAEEARKRLQSAAEMKLELPKQATPGAKATIVVAITNVGAGHAIPTSITELRQVWIDLRVVDAGGHEIYRSGAIDERGQVDPEAVMYHAVLADENGKVTYLPWRAAKMLKEKLIGPKQTVRERYEVEFGAGARPPFRVTATLRYRSAPQDVMDELFGKGKYVIETVDMAEAAGEIR